MPGPSPEKMPTEGEVEKTEGEKEFPPTAEEVESEFDKRRKEVHAAIEEFQEKEKETQIERLEEIATKSSRKIQEAFEHYREYIPTFVKMQMEGENKFQKEWREEHGQEEE